MNRSRFATAAITAALSFALLLPYSSAVGEDELLAAMESAKTKASTYETAGNFGMAYSELVKYADATDALADAGALPRKHADVAEAWRDALHYEPSVYLAEPSDDGVFFGGDGVFAKGSSAVKICVPYGCYAEDFAHLIPSVSGELLISVGLEITNERAMRDIAFGKKDDYIIDNLRQISRMEGRVYFAFCPAVNTLKNTRTVAQSFTDAYRHVADLARRHAPGVKLMLTLGDVAEAGDGTFEKFYPGDGYVDAVGVELCHTYNRSYPSSPTAAFDGRGVYYDPVYSVRRISSKLSEIAGETLPLVVDGCAFPWAGTAARDDWQEQMKRFYTLLPAVCPETVGVLYSNESSSEGICNLRQNPEAMALYEECLTLPWYRDHREKYKGLSAVPVGERPSVAVGKAMKLYLYCGGRFTGEEGRVFLDGREVLGDGVAFTEGDHRLTVYVTSRNFQSKLEWDVTVTSSGEFSATAIKGKYDFNGNGFTDFGDAESVMAKIAGWSVDIGAMDPDVNGDGRVNLSDVSVIRGELSPR